MPLGGRAARDTGASGARARVREAGPTRRALILGLGVALLLAVGARSLVSRSADTGANAPPTCPGAPGPFGGPLVFVAQQDLYATEEDGRGTTRLTTLPEGTWAHDPAWSPDGETLAFTLNALAADRRTVAVGIICGLDRRTGAGRLLARSPAATDLLDHPAWTPDAQALLLTVQRAEQPPASARYGLADGSLTPSLAGASAPALSPDGRYLAYLRAAARADERPRTTLVLARADGQGARIIEPPPPAAGVIDAIGAARWSPDSRHLVFTVTSGPPDTASAPGWRTVLERVLGITAVAAHGNHADLWIVGADGTGLRQLTSKELDAAQAAWSPDGRRLAYTSDDGILVRDLASGEERRLPAQDGQTGGLAWAPR